MNMLLQNPIFLWISVGCLFLPEKSEACPNNDLPAQCDFVSGNVCLELAGESKTWSEARSSCGKKKGKLLQVLDSSIKIFLSGITKEGNTSNLTWWMGEKIEVDHREPTLNFSRTLCTYIKLNPVQYITSDCSEKRDFLCSHTLLSPSSTKTTMSNYATKSRFKRSISDMLSVVGNITQLLGVATTALLQMEKTEGEPTNDHRDNFVQFLLNSTKQLSKSAVKLDIVNTIMNLSTGIMLFSMKKCDIATNPNPNNFFEKVFEIIQTIALLNSPPLNQNTVTNFSTGTIYQSTRKPADLSDMVLGSESNGAFIKLPSYAALSPFLAQYDIVVAQMATFTTNPHPSDDNISGIVCNVLLSAGTSEIMVENLSEMIEIFLHRPNSSAVMNSTFVLMEGQKSLTTFNVSDPQMTIIFDVDPSINVSLSLTLSHGSPPNSTYFSNTTILNSTRGYRWMITPDMLQETPGVWYVDARFLNSQDTGVALTVSSFVTKCLYWHTENNTWTTDGCRVGEQSTPELTQCLCNHLTLFGSSFFVMPNYVDVSRTAELFSTVSQNYVVLCLLCAFFGVYLVTLMWACYADRRASSKRKITLLMDNHPAAQYNYLICIQTGHRKKAGTSAKVSVKLIGSEGESNTHELTDPDKKVFERGSTDMFILAAPFPLGEVRNIRLQHDCSGGHPSWYISKVTIQDLQSRHVWHFFCNCWLSDDRGDGMTKKTFNAAKSNEITCFRNIFQSRTSTGFRDEHIWVSILDPPSRSPFTRAQRVSCCMSLLLCTMAINIAFWNIPVDASSPVLLSLGSMQITFQEFMVGVQSGLLMFPINILIITIFRSIRPRMSSLKSKDGDPEMKLRSLAFTIPALLKNTEEVISLLKESPRNKMSDSHKLESTDDLLPALDSVHVLIQNMQGETESDNHLVFCSKFLLASLCHVLECLKKLDGNSFSNPQSYQQVLSLTDLMVRKTEMVFSSHLTNCPPPVRRKKKKSAGCRLPWWYVFLGWFLLLSISGISTYFTLLYGFEYGKEKSIKWVMSLGLSLFESIFILQPLKVIGVAVFFAMLLKPVAVEDTEEVEQVLLAQEDKCRRYTGRATL